MSAFKIPIEKQFWLLKSAIDTLEEGVVVVDKTDKFAFSNQAAQRILGLGAPYVPPHQWPETYGLLDPGTQKPIPSQEFPLTKALLGVSSDHVPLLIRNRQLKDDASFTITGRSIKDDRGNVEGAVVVFQGPTQLIQSKKEFEHNYQNLKELEGLRDRLVQMMVHDLKSPLTVIYGTLGIVVDRLRIKNERLPETLMGMLDNALEATVQIKAMVNSLLDLRRLEEDKLEPKKSEVNLADLTEKCLTFMGHSVSSKALTTEKCFPKSVPLVQADQALMQRIILNLLSNGIKHAPTGGKICFSLSVDFQRKEVLYSIQDNGPGIPSKYLENIFDPFFQVNRPDFIESGHGLGLTFCRMAVEAHGGRIWAESELHKWSRFCIRLPINGS